MGHATKEERTVYARLRRARLIASGLCAACGGRPPRPNRRLCSYCTDVIARVYARNPAKSAAYYMARRRRRKRKGQCTLCGRQRDQETTLCSLCLIKARNRFSKRHESGRCVQCGTPVTPGKRSWRCPRCTARHAGLTFESAHKQEATEWQRAATTLFAVREMARQRPLESPARRKPALKASLSLVRASRHRLIFAIS